MVVPIDPAYDRWIAVASTGGSPPIRDSSRLGLVMEPIGLIEPDPLRGLDLGLLRRAVDIYLAIAYPGVEPPQAVRRRLDWPIDVEAPELLNKLPFEKVGKAPGDKPIFGLRLGNLRYPHMKMQVQPWDGKDGFLLSVNTHDHALAIDPNAPDVEAFMALQAENQRLKVEIETAWDEAGLPTFPRYLRDYLLTQAGSPRAPG